jgi:hypothetical protein
MLIVDISPYDLYCAYRTLILNYFSYNTYTKYISKTPIIGMGYYQTKLNPVFSLISFNITIYQEVLFDFGPPLNL